jgi:uncharacterized protein (TIGR00297 family)
METLALGFFLGGLVALAAWRAQTLTLSGALAAALTGGLIFGLGGLPWAALLITFFVSSSALSKAFRRRKAALDEKFSKGSQRDWGQVLANGGLGAALAVLFAIHPAPWMWAAFAGAMATVNADTWATEIGVLSGRAPRLITSGKTVERGASGGISTLGTLAALGGAALIGLVGVVIRGESPALFAIAAVSGVIGSFFDSLLGATVQSIYFCPHCQKETERHPRHLCGNPTIPRRGWRWLNNDWVNFWAACVGAACAAIIWALWTSGVK